LWYCLGVFWGERRRFVSVRFKFYVLVVLVGLLLVRLFVFIFLTNFEMKKIDEKSIDLHAQFSECGKNAKEWARRCMLLLPEIDKYKVWRKKGFGSIYEYAAKIAGLGRFQVNESLRILEKIEQMPALQEVVRKKGLWAVKPVATIVTKETDKEWAERAENMSKHELEVFVKGVRIESGRPGTSFQPVKESITITLDPELLDQLKKIKGDRDWDDVVDEFLVLRSKALETKKPEPVKTESRNIPTQIQRFVRKRDSHRCVVPGCGRQYSEFHHADGFSRVKVHDPARIFCLCTGHHDLAHRGLIANEEKGPREWSVRKESDRTSSRFGIDQLVQKRRFLATV